jgi:hypothetical protein
MPIGSLKTVQLEMDYQLSIINYQLSIINYEVGRRERGV